MGSVAVDLTTTKGRERERGKRGGCLPLDMRRLGGFPFSFDIVVVGGVGILVLLPNAKSQKPFRSQKKLQRMN